MQRTLLTITLVSFATLTVHAEESEKPILSVEKALKMADAQRGKITQLVSVENVLPPKVQIVTPGPNERLITKSPLTLKATAQSVGNHPVTAMRLLLDGRPYDGNLGIINVGNPRLGEVQGA